MQQTQQTNIHALSRFRTCEPNTIKGFQTARHQDRLPYIYISMYNIGAYSIRAYLIARIVYPSGTEVNKRRHANFHVSCKQWRHKFNISAHQAPLA
jgi:hypothetical protein